MTLIGCLPMDSKGKSSLHHVVHDDQIAYRDQRHEAGHQMSVAFDPMVNANIAVCERLGSDVGYDVFRQSVELGREVFAAHDAPPARGHASADAWRLRGQHRTTCLIPSCESFASPYLYGLRSVSAHSPARPEQYPSTFDAPAMSGASRAPAEHQHQRDGRQQNNQSNRVRVDHGVRS